MNEVSITQYITDAFDGVHFVIVDNNTFFFYDPVSDLPPDRRFPFATLMTNDLNDTASNLNRPSIFRLNIGVSKQTYRSLFGSQTSPSGEDGEVDPGYDFTTLDQLLPHPVYGRMYWVCVLNPTESTFQVVQSLLAEAYEMAVSKSHKRASPETL